jgi:hypothetical protein
MNKRQDKSLWKRAMNRSKEGGYGTKDHCRFTGWSVGCFRPFCREGWVSFLVRIVPATIAARSHSTARTDTRDCFHGCFHNEMKQDGTRWNEKSKSLQKPGFYSMSVYVIVDWRELRI